VSRRVSQSNIAQLWGIRDGALGLVFADRKITRRGFRCSATLADSTKPFTVTLQMIRAHRRFMLAFFLECAKCARENWRGEINWHSQNWEIAITFLSQDEQISLEISLLDEASASVDRQAVLHVSPECLERFALSLPDFLQLDPAEPMPMLAFSSEPEA